MRIGLFGGSFDPVHYGHLLLAEYAREQARLDQVWFLPAAVAPHKQNQPAAPPESRLEMLRLAIGGHEPFHVCTHEIERGGVSYTARTLRELTAAQPDDEFLLLLGGDSLADLPQWRRPDEICRLAIPVAVARPGHPVPDYEPLAPLVDAERLELFRRQGVAMPLIELSSREIRRRVAAGESIRFQTPRAVEQYIAAAGLYRRQAACGG